MGPDKFMGGFHLMGGADGGVPNGVQLNAAAPTAELQAEAVI